MHCDGVRSDGYCPFSIVPITFKYLCYPIIAYFGLGAVSASVMSSADSSLLSISTLLTLNVFVPIQEALGFREDPKWTPRVLKIFICIVGTYLWHFQLQRTDIFVCFLNLKVPFKLFSDITRNPGTLDIHNNRPKLIIFSRERLIYI